MFRLCFFNWWSDQLLLMNTNCLAIIVCARSLDVPGDQDRETSFATGHRSDVGVGIRITARHQMGIPARPPLPGQIVGRRRLRSRGASPSRGHRQNLAVHHRRRQNVKRYDNSTLCHFRPLSDHRLLPSTDRGPHRHGTHGPRLRDGDDEDDRQAHQHSQPARLLHAGRPALRHRRIRTAREPARFSAPAPTQFRIRTCHRSARM